MPVPPGTVDGAAGAGSIPPATVGNLEPSTEYCVRVCMEDETAGGGYICSNNPTSFTTPAAPAVETDPPYYIGKSDQSRPRSLLFDRTPLLTNPSRQSHTTPRLITHCTGHNNGSTLSGSYNSFVPGHDLSAYYLYAPCDTFNTSAMSTSPESIPSTSGNGSISPVAVTGLPAETLICARACVLDLDANATMGDPTGPVCGAVQTFIWPLPVRIHTLPHSSYNCRVLF